MLRSAVEIMCCPDCQGSLELEVFTKKLGRVEDGLLTCKTCRVCYIVCDYIPRMVPENLYNNHEFCKKYAIDTETLLKQWSDVKIDICTIQNHTESNFGYEWEHYANLGWTENTGSDDSSTVESIRWFHEKSLLKENDILITQDYELAGFALQKKAMVINPLGFVYTNENIDGLLQQRYLSAKHRNAGGRVKNKKRSHLDDDLFIKNLLELIEKGYEND